MNGKQIGYPPYDLWFGLQDIVVRSRGSTYLIGSETQALASEGDQWRDKRKGQYHVSSIKIMKYLIKIDRVFSIQQQFIHLLKHLKPSSNIHHEHPWANLERFHWGITDIGGLHSKRGIKKGRGLAVKPETWREAFIKSSSPIFRTLSLLKLTRWIRLLHRDI